MDNTYKPPVILSLCTGMCGLERGVERALGRKAQIAAYVEIEAWAAWNLVNGMEKGILAPAPVWTDVKTFPGAAFHGKVDGITAGYPCQPFSLAGKRGGAEDPRHLWPHICRIIEAIQPIWCFLENVPGHLTMGFDEVYRSLREMGYRVEAGLYSAAEVGAPHKRARLFILAMENTMQQRGGGWIDERDTRLRCENQTERPDTMGNAELGLSGSALANSNCVRREGQPSETEHQWPAPPGPQYDWEPPRTVKPGVGYVIDGYNHWADLLRLAGNAVVPQTAEKAFMELSKKMMK